MKQIKCSLCITVSLLAAVAGQAQKLAIESFDSTGQLTFNRLATAETYRVEWAPSPAGPWTNFAAAAASMDSIAQFTTGSYTCSVPMCYRVVARLLPDGMVLIPGGTNAGTDPDSGAYSLTVDSFYMDRCEVTKTAWDEVRSWAVTNGYTDLPSGSSKAAGHPVQMVNGMDCVKWCNARSQKAGLTPVYYTGPGTTSVYKAGMMIQPFVHMSANGYRLPTDMQWEYAARGGVAGRRFPWSDVDTIQHARANYFSISNCAYDTSPTRGYHPDYDDGDYPYTSPAGSFDANGFGLYDMAGNLFEWSDTLYSNDGLSWYRVANGGGWNSDGQCGVSLRFIFTWDVPSNYIGFRTVLPRVEQ